MSASKGSAGGARALARLARQVEKALEALELSMPQFRVLSLLADGSSASSALAGRLAVSPPSLTAVVDGLVARGMVERRADADDRRRLSLQLTASGKKALRAAEAAIESRLAEIGAHLEDPESAASVIEALAVWNHALDEYREAQRAATAR
jgi:long-chain acyl-CoA synthetase